MPYRRLCLCIFLVWFIALGTGCPLRAAEKERVRIGVCLSLSGDFADFGRIYLAGIRLRLEEYAANSGDREVELVVRDDKSDEATAAAAVRELVDEVDVAAIIGSVSSGVTLAMAEETKPRGLVLVTPSATSPRLGHDGDGIVRVLFDDEFQGEALAAHIARQLGLRRAAVLLNEQFEYSRSIAKAFQTNFIREGGAIILETYDMPLSKVETYDFRPQLRRIQAQKPDVVLIPSYPEEVAAVLRQAQEVGLNARFCGGDAWHHESTMLTSGNYLEGAFYISVMDEENPSGRLLDFENLLNRSNYDADIVSGQGYDAMSIVLEAMKSGRRRALLLEGVYGISDFPLVTGDITICRKRGSLKPAYIVEVVKEGGHFVRKVVDIIKPRLECDL